LEDERAKQASISKRFAAMLRHDPAAEASMLDTTSPLQRSQVPAGGMAATGPNSGYVSQPAKREPKDFAYGPKDFAGLIAETGDYKTAMSLLAPQDRPSPVKDVNGRLRYPDTGEYVFSDLVKDPPQADPETWGDPVMMTPAGGGNPVSMQMSGLGNWRPSEYDPVPDRADDEMFFAEPQAFMIGGDMVVGQMGNKGTFKPIPGASMPESEKDYGPKYWSDQRHSYVRMGVDGKEELVEPAPGYEYTNKGDGRGWVATKMTEDGDELTTLIKDYRYAQKHNNFDGTLLEWRNSRPPSAVQNVNMTGPEFQALDDALTAETRFLDEARNASMMLQMLDNGLETGGLRPIGTAISNILADLGVNIDPNLPFAQAFTSMAAPAILALRSPADGGGLTGNTSDKDLRFLTSAVAGVDKSEEANKILLIIAVAKARRNAAFANIKSGVLSRDNKLNAYRGERQEYIDNNPLFTPQEEARLTQLGISGGRTGVVSGFGNAE
jgi:hypothetical protein